MARNTRRRQDAPATAPRRQALAPSRRLHTAASCAVLIVAALVAYLPSFHGVFLFDDAAEITDSESITRLTPLSRFFEGSSRPVASITFALNHATGGLDPFGYHVVNLAVHVLAGLLLFGLSWRLLRGRVADDGRAMLLALVISLLWLVHPLNTQAVTYIVQRAESLAAMFSLATLYAFVRAAEHSGAMEHVAARKRTNRVAAAGWSILAAICCTLGMATKQTALVVPVIVLLCDVVLLARRPREALSRRWPIHLAILATWATPLSLGVFSTALGSDDPFTATGFGFMGISPVDYLKTQAGVILYYLRLTAWPHPLSLDYHWPVATSPAQYLAPGLIVLGLLAAAATGCIRRRAAGFLLAAFFVLLAPTSSIVPIKDVIFEHRMYLPLAPIIALIVLLVDRLTVDRAPPRLRVTIVAFAAIALAAATFERNRVYQDAVGMWTDVVSRQPDSARAYNNLGNALDRAGRAAEARDAFQAALRLDPRHADAHYNLGRLLHDAGRLDEAVAAYRRSQELAPHQIESSIMLGNALSETGELAAAATQFERAIANAMPRTPRILLARAHFNLGNTRARQGRIDEAERHYHAALAARADYAPALRGLGMVASRQNRIEDAIAHYRAALSLNPADTDAKAALDKLLKTRPP